MYIEREKALELIERYDKDAAIREIKRLPAADVRSERHGHIVIKSRVLGNVKTYKCPQCYHKWQENDRARVNETLCSECDAVLAGSFQNFCPRCGAKMDGEGQQSEMNDWIDVKIKKPPENQIVETKIDDEKGIRNETELIYYKGLWWFLDKSMYVYYTPTHWRYTNGKDGAKNGIST